MKIFLYRILVIGSAMVAAVLPLGAAYIWLWAVVLAWKIFGLAGVSAVLAASLWGLVRLLRSSRAKRLEGYFRACRGATLADLNRIDEAREQLDAAEVVLTRVADPHLLAALELHRGHVACALARQTSGGSLRHAVLRSAETALGVHANRRSDDTRFAHRALSAGTSSSTSPR